MPKNKDEIPLHHAGREDYNKYLGSRSFSRGNTFGNATRVTDPSKFRYFVAKKS